MKPMPAIVSGIRVSVASSLDCRAELMEIPGVGLLPDEALKLPILP